MENILMVGLDFDNDQKNYSRALSSRYYYWGALLYAAEKARLIGGRPKCNKCEGHGYYYFERLNHQKRKNILPQITKCLPLSKVLGNRR